MKYLKRILGVLLMIPAYIIILFLLWPLDMVIRGYNADLPPDNWLWVFVTDLIDK